MITTATTAKGQGTLPYGTVLDAETTASTNQKFTSYDRSDKTGLDYAVNRIYSSEQARFLQPDPIGMASVDLTDPQTLNMYTYAGNNPIDLVDPSGTMMSANRWWSGGGGGYSPCTAQYSYSDCGGHAGFWGIGGRGWGGHVAEYNRTFGDAPPAVARGMARYEAMLERQRARREAQDAGVIATVDVYWTNGSYEFDRWDFRDINLANLIRARDENLASQQSEPGGDWRVRELVRGGAPTAKAARPALTAIATVMSFFTLPVAAAGNGVAAGVGKATVEVTRWGSSLQSGSWVMKGGNTWKNYIFSGKYQPSWFPGGNIPATKASATTYNVSKSSVKFPVAEGGKLNPMNWVKYAMGQRQYIPK